MKEITTRQRIAEAALGAFAEQGFEGTSTRAIARRAKVNQGLITYYFKSKEALWKEAANLVFSEARSMLEELVEQTSNDDEADKLAAYIRALVGFMSRRPEVMRFLVQEGMQSNERLTWMVENHLREIYEKVPSLSGDAKQRPYEFYILTGAAALIFTARQECMQMTGLDPMADEAIEKHAQILTELLT